MWLTACLVTPPIVLQDALRLIRGWQRSGRRSLYSDVTLSRSPSNTPCDETLANSCSACDRVLPAQRLIGEGNTSESRVDLSTIHQITQPYTTYDYYTSFPTVKGPNSNGTCRIAQQIDVADTLQAAQKQGPMRIQINQMNWFGRPYPQDTHDHVHVRTEVGAFRERKRLPHTYTETAPVQSHALC